MVIDSIFMAFRNLYRHKLRTFLTVLGIIIGTCSVATIYSVGTGGRQQIVGVFKTFGIDGLVISSPSSAAGISTKSLTMQDIELVENNLREVNAALPVLMEQTKVGIHKFSTDAYTLGVSDQNSGIAGIVPKYGRGFTQNDVNTDGRVCIVDTELARRMYKRENIVGKQIDLTISGVQSPFTVVGVVENADSTIGSLVGAFAPTLIYVPYTTVMDLTGDDSFESFAVQLKSDANVSISKEKIISQLESSNGITGYRTENMSQHEEKIEDIIGLVTMIISAVAAVSLIVGGIGVMTVMLVAVNERKREIGLKKAIGATRRDILLEFIIEAIAISLFGGAVGIGLSYLLSAFSERLIGIEAAPNLTISILSLLFCAIIGIIFSVYPARKAAALDPIDCLKYE